MPAESKTFLEGCEKPGLHLVVVADWMMFGPVVGQIGSTRSPEKMKLFLVDTVIP